MPKITISAFSLRSGTGRLRLLQRLTQHLSGLSQILPRRSLLPLRNGMAVEVAQPDSDPILRFLEECCGQGPVSPGEGGSKIAQLGSQHVEGNHLGNSHLSFSHRQHLPLWVQQALTSAATAEAAQ